MKEIKNYQLIKLLLQKFMSNQDIVSIRRIYATRFLKNKEENAIEDTSIGTEVIFKDAVLFIYKDGSYRVYEGIQEARLIDYENHLEILTTKNGMNRVLCGGKDLLERECQVVKYDQKVNYTRSIKRYDEIKTTNTFIEITEDGKNRLYKFSNTVYKKCIDWTFEGEICKETNLTPHKRLSEVILKGEFVDLLDDIIISEDDRFTYVYSICDLNLIGVFAKGIEIVLDGTKEYLIDGMPYTFSNNHFDEDSISLVSQESETSFSK